MQLSKNNSKKLQKSGLHKYTGKICYQFAMIYQFGSWLAKKNFNL